MIYSVENPTLEQLEHRLQTDKKLLSQHPENKELLEKRIKMTIRAINNRKLFKLSFMEAMDAVFNGKYVQEEDFKWNCYLMEKEGRVIIGSFDEQSVSKYLDYGNAIVTKHVLDQKYRVVSVLNRSGLYHE